MIKRCGEFLLARWSLCVLLLGIGMGSVAVCRGRTALQGRDDTTTIDVGNEHPATIIQFVNDSPEEVGNPERVYQARIDWPIQSEEFALRLNRACYDVSIPHRIPPGERVTVRFTVEDDPPFRTKFTRGEWFVLGTAEVNPKAPRSSVVCVSISSFRRFSEERMKAMAP